MTERTPRESLVRGGLRVSLALLVLLLVGALAAAAAASSDGAERSLELPTVADIGDVTAPIEDVVLGPSARVLGPQPPNTYGGPHLTATGESVTVYASNAYGGDSAFTQRWAEFVAKLIHGAELARMTLHLVPGTELRRICGRFAEACYSPRDERIVAPGEDPAGGPAAEAVVAHEYGHHVALNRSNAPWRAVDYGTKRWATQMNVCERARAGELHPGARDSERYRRNPGEGFAESYRLLNERRVGVPAVGFEIVSRLLYPDEPALAAVAEDVTQPWTRNTETTTSGVLRNQRARTLTVATPLDGTFQVRLTAPAQARFTLELLARGGRRVARATTTAGRSMRALTTTICGQRSLRVRVASLRGAGAYTLSISRP